MSQPYSHVASTMQTLVRTGSKSAAKYLSPQHVVKVTRQIKPHRGEQSETFLVTIGKPNFLGRRFVKQCIKVGEPFPVKKVQIKAFPKKAQVKAS